MVNTEHISLEEIEPEKSKDTAEPKRFNQELQTVSIGDYTPIARGETLRPFSSDLYPRGTILPKYNRENVPPDAQKFKYIESSVHGRTIDEVLPFQTIWADKYNIKYGARDLKGARHEKVAIIVNDLSNRISIQNFKRDLQKGNQELAELEKDKPYNLIRASGLYDETDVSYLIKASDYLRKNSIPTENVVCIYEINEVILNGERTPLKVWAVANLLEHIRLQEESGNPDKKLIADIAKFAAETKFYEVEREVQVSERIRDIAVCKTEDEFLALIENPIKWLNTLAKVTGEGVIPGSEKPEYFDIQGYKNLTGVERLAKKEEFKRYLRDWLPSQMGKYLGKLKKVGVKNDFGHAQQWSAVASMYDAQSFVGRELNGQTLKEEDYIISLQEALGVLEELFRPSEGNFVQKEFGEGGETLQIAKEHLLTNYLLEIGFPKNKHKEMYSYENLFDNSFFDGSKSNFRFLDPEIYINVMGKFGFTFDEKAITDLWKKRSAFLDEVHKKIGS
ncbi:hypothetical protein HYV31_02110 [candidate division WWE3 bacterium]|nr:hypothetical protein [candidate division WWE3 bacterium]